MAEMAGVNGGRFEVQRAKNLERARRSGVSDSVARLFAVVQEPRCDDEPSTPNFDAILREESTLLRKRINQPTTVSGSLVEAGGFGGLVETETTTSAIRLLRAAETNNLSRAADLLRAALDRCDGVHRPDSHSREIPLFPEHERISHPKTGRPIGMWR